MAKAEITISAVDQTRQAFDGVKRNLVGLESAANTLRGTLAGIGVGLSAGAFVGFVRTSIDAADELGKLSQKVGVTVESLSELQYAGKLADVSTEQLGDGLRKLSVNLQAAALGSTEMRNAFTAVGISAGELVNIKPDEALRRVAEAFANTEDGASKTAAAVKLFGRSGADLIPLLNSGAEGLRAAGEEARRFGVVVSGDAARAAERFNDNMTRLSSSASSFGVEIANIVLPSLGKFTDELLAGIRIFDGFASALFNIGFGIDPFKGLGENLRSTRQELDQLYKSLRSTPVGDNRARAFLEGRIETFEKRLEFLKFQERQAIAERGAGGVDARDLQLQAAGRRRASLPDVAVTGAKLEAELADGAERGARIFTQIYLDQFKVLREQARGVQVGLMEEFEAGNELDARNMTEAAQALDRILGGTRSGQERAVFKDLEVLNDALIVGRINAEQYEEAYEKIQERLNEVRGIAKDAAKDVADDWKLAFASMKFAVEGWGRDFTETLAESVETGKLQVAELVQSVLRDLLRLQIQNSVTVPLFNALGGRLGTLFGTGAAPTGSGIGPGAGQGLQLPGRANGGPVSANTMYMVGERGPELFVPNSAGTIVPNGAGGGFTQIINVAPGVDAGAVYRAAAMGAAMAKSDIARGVRIGEIG